MNTLDITKIRKDFPQLKDPNYHFLDSASSSLPPQVVINAVADYYTKDKANVHRGAYGAAVRATEHYEAARATVAKFLNAFSEEIIFSSGATEASNMLMRSIEISVELHPGDEIVTTVMEHHASILPLQQLAKRKQLVLKHIPMNDDFSLNYVEAEKLITDRTKIVAVILASNVIGTINDVRHIADLAHAKGALMISDATAAAGHTAIDVRMLDADMLYFSGHKLLAPTGVGVLWIKHALLERLEPSEFGGHMIEEATLTDSTWAKAPTKFEAGTKDIGGVIGLGAALKYIEAFGIDAIEAHTRELVAYAVTSLKKVPGLTLYAMEDPKQNIGIVSFSAEWVHPHDIAEILARDQVAVRAGHHCAMPLHYELGTKGTVRASFHLYNTKEDIDALVESILKAKEIFNK